MSLWTVIPAHRNDKAGSLSWLKKWWERTNTELASTLTESEAKVREEIKEGTSLDLSQAQNKMGIIWGQIGSGYQWLLLLWFLLTKVQGGSNMTKWESDVWKDLNIIVSCFIETLKYLQ